MRKTLVLILLTTLAMADVIEASGRESVDQFLTAHQDSVSSLLFYSPKSKGLSNLFGIFTKDEVDSDFMAKVAENSHLMKIDASQDQYSDLKDRFGFEQTPWIVVYDHGRQVMSEAPTTETEQKITDLVAKYIPKESTDANTPENAQPAGTTTTRPTTTTTTKPSSTTTTRPTTTTTTKPAPMKSSQQPHVTHTTPVQMPPQRLPTQVAPVYLPEQRVAAPAPLRLDTHPVPTHQRLGGTQPQTWSDKGETHTVWEDTEVFYVDPLSPMGAELIHEAAYDTYGHQPMVQQRLAQPAMPVRPAAPVMPARPTQQLKTGPGQLKLGGEIPWRSSIGNYQPIHVKQDIATRDIERVTTTNGQRIDKPVRNY